MTASEIFKDKKDNYPQSVPKLFVSTRLSKTRTFFRQQRISCETCTGFMLNTMLKTHVLSCSDGEDINPKVLQALGSEKMKVSYKTKSSVNAVCKCIYQVIWPSSFCSQYAVPVTKYDRKGYKPRSRQLLLTSNSAVIVEEGKLKQRIDYGALKGSKATASFSLFLMDVASVGFISHINCPPPAGISVSSLSDGLFVLHVPSDDNKQKVGKHGRITLNHYIWSKSNLTIYECFLKVTLFAGVFTGRCGSAERPCDRDLDQDCDLLRQSKQHQHQPGQVRSRNTCNIHLALRLLLLLHAQAYPGRKCLTLPVFLLQYKVYSGSGERGHHRLHPWIRTTGGQGEEWTLVCGESAIFLSYSAL